MSGGKQPYLKSTSCVTTTSNVTLKLLFSIWPQHALLILLFSVWLQHPKCTSDLFSIWLQHRLLKLLFSVWLQHVLLKLLFRVWLYVLLELLFSAWLHPNLPLKLFSVYKDIFWWSSHANKSPTVLFLVYKCVFYNSIVCLFIYWRKLYSVKWIYFSDGLPDNTKFACSNGRLGFVVS